MYIPYHSFFGASRNLQQRLERDWVWSGKSPYFTLSFSFQINISVTSSVGLLRNLCGNLVEKFVSDQSSGLKEMLQLWMRWSLDEISGSLVQQVISRHCSARLSAVKVWNIIKNIAYAAIVHGFSN